MVDGEYYNLDLTGKVIEQRLADVETLKDKVEEIGEYHDDKPSTGYIKSLQENISNVSKKVDGLNVTNLTQQVNNLAGTVNSQTKAIEDNKEEIGNLKIKTLGINQAPNALSLQDQINSKVSQSNFNTQISNITKWLKSIESQNSKQDTKLAAIGRIKEGENEGSGDLRKLQEIIETYGDINDIRNDITNLSTDLITLSKRVEVLENQILNK